MTTEGSSPITAASATGLQVGPLWGLLRPLLFRLDAERAHGMAMALAARWSKAFSGKLGEADQARSPGLRLRAMGLGFPNPIGLAAGLDKDAEAVPLWQQCGFGFIEVGTVTALPQPGNPRPRLFRLPADGALVNRMGFNNAGAEAMAVRLTRLRERELMQVPLGVNLGKSKVTPAAQAAADYQRSSALLAELADYLVVNISSPNTPGLRDLQTGDQVRALAEAVQGPNQRLTQPRPVLLKLAPDLADADAIACAEAAIEAGCAGLILTNTTIDFKGLSGATVGMSGGLSGRPLFARSTRLLGLVREALGPDPILIGTGGIFTPEDVAAKLEAGAQLVQLYTGLIYAGPGLVRRLLCALESHP
ncbi:MAG: quinone-dependent dihydroorotate dehydrogenase [Lamprobacter sp.]|uniref:quinone-dependent dihydroorotate dehydrogenase n=1 Tax=Lamprobacter sp. TaxID=3100796 RepID=UPI002B262341|nr:quinone-dependent dihydroorotate dehydrogenase [Lamprobacter sp.]MEA3642331.1 quinone-dependent dihydroorotate dehydrogenase [Lamprobacter sp.]